MSDDATEGKHEIVIVRRRSNDDAAGGKGGAWKIAYADFVTAMMAFFLVMWLINASNEETRAQVASYFNPIKLSDSSTGNRGLKDKKDSKSTQKGESEANAGGTPPSAPDARHESELMADPDKILARIESKLDEGKPGVSGGEGATVEEFSSSQSEQQAPGVGDPFDPRAWENVPEAPVPVGEEDEQNEQDASAPNEPSAELTALEQTPPEETSPQPSEVNQPVQQTEEQWPSVAAPGIASTPSPRSSAPAVPVKPQNAEANAEQSVREQPQAKETGLVGPLPVDRENAIAQPSSEQDKADQRSAARADADAIAAGIAAELGTGLDDLPASIDVETTDEGLLISLTDRNSFGMFKTGSAEPEPELVRLVEAIAGVLAKKPGYIVVRGHTDSRPYRNKKYDNWQLSTARAHLAQYMLVRGGIDEKRIRRVEGFADRDPKVPEDPQAPQNRRIEILLGREGA